MRAWFNKHASIGGESGGKGPGAEIPTAGINAAMSAVMGAGCAFPEQPGAGATNQHGRKRLYCGVRKFDNAVAAMLARRGLADRAGSAGDDLLHRSHATRSSVSYTFAEVMESLWDVAAHYTHIAATEGCASTGLEISIERARNATPNNEGGGRPTPYCGLCCATNRRRGRNKRSNARGQPW